MAFPQQCKEKRDHGICFFAPNESILNITNIESTFVEYICTLGNDIICKR